MWLFWMMVLHSGDALPFVSTWLTVNGSEVITLPLNDQLSYDLQIDWGDGGPLENYTNLAGVAPKHTYFVPQEHVISIFGPIVEFRFASVGDCQKITKILAWGDFMVNDKSTYMFSGCTNLNLNATDQPQFLAGATMNYMFASCSSLNAQLTWDTSNVTSMQGVFKDASKFNRAITFSNCSSVTDMSYMFSGCSGFNSALLLVDTSNVLNMSFFFDTATKFNKPLNFSTASVTDMTSMFYQASSFNQSLSAFNTSSVVKMKRMFGWAISFGQSLDGFDVSSVVDMSIMFEKALSFKSVLNFNTQSVTDMSYMFYQHSTYNQPLSFNTSLVTTMTSMFSNAATFNSQLYFTDTSRVRTMDSMFYFASSFNQTLNFQTSNTTSMKYMFNGASKFNQPLAFNTSSVFDMSYMFAFAARFNQALTWDTTSLRQMQFMFSDATNFNSPLAFSTSQVIDMTGVFNNAYQFNQVLNWDTRSVISMKKMFMAASSYNQPTSFNTSSCTDMTDMFLAADNFNSMVNFSDTSSVTLMSYMFAQSPFNQPVLFNTARVTSMNQMFEGSTSFNQRVDFNTSSVTDMSYMFVLATAFNQPVNFDTRNVIYITSMFEGCSTFNQPINFNLTNANDLQFMFNGATKLNKPVNLIGTSGVLDMTGMFEGCSAFNQPLSFSTSGCQDMGAMFYGASSFNYPLNFNTSQVVNMSRMFANATKLDQAFTFDTSLVTDMTAMFEGAVSMSHRNLASFATDLTTKCAGFCTFCGLPKMSNCLPCPNNNTRWKNSADWSVCACQPLELAMNATLRCVSLTAAPTPATPGTQIIIPAGTTSVVLPSGSTIFVVGENDNNVTVIITPMDHRLTGDGEGDIISSDVPIEFQPAAESCSPVCTAFDPISNSLGKRCEMNKGSGREIRCFCNSTIMAYVYQGIVCEPPSNFGFLVPLFIYSAIFAYVTYRLYVRLRRDKESIRLLTGSSCRMHTRALLQRKCSVLVLLLFICTVRFSQNIGRLPNAGLSDGGKTACIVIPMLLQFIILRMLLNPTNRRDFWVVNVCALSLLLFAALLFLIPSAGSSSSESLAFSGILCTLELLMLCALVHFTRSGYFNEERILTTSNTRVIGGLLFLLALQSACTCFGNTFDGWLVGAAGVVIVADFTFLALVLYDDKHERKTSISMRKLALVAVSGQLVVDHEAVWFDTFIKSDRAIPLVGGHLFTAEQIADYDSDAIEVLRPLIGAEALHLAALGSPSNLVALQAKPQAEAELVQKLQNQQPCSHPFYPTTHFVSSKNIHQFNSVSHLVSVADCTSLTTHSCDSLAKNSCFFVKRADARNDVACLLTQRLMNSLWSHGTGLEGVSVVLAKYIVVGRDFLCVDWIKNSYSYSEVSRVPPAFLSRLGDSAVGLFVSAYILGIPDHNFMIRDDGVLFSTHFTRALVVEENPSFAITREFFGKMQEREGFWYRFVERCVAAYMAVRVDHLKVVRLAELGGWEEGVVAKFIASRLQLSTSDSQALINIRAKLQLFDPVFEQKEVPIAPYQPIYKEPGIVTIEFEGNVQITKPLGHGAFGRVDQCIWTGADCAIKRLLNPSPAAEQDFLREVEINRHLSPFKHQFVVSFLGLTSQPPGILMELYPLRSVEDFIIRGNNLSSSSDLKNILTVLINASAGLMHLHKYNVIHRDIAARNFLIKHDLSTAICDFGLALLLTKGEEVGQRSPTEKKRDLLPINTSAPESLTRAQYSAKSDVFMFGNFIWELFARRQPHADDKDLDMQSKNFARFAARVRDGLQPSIPSSWPQELSCLLQACWSLTPSDRPSMTEVNQRLRNFRTLAEGSNLPMPAPSSQGVIVQSEINYYEVDPLHPNEPSIYSVAANPIYRSEALGASVSEPGSLYRVADAALAGQAVCPEPPIAQVASLYGIVEPEAACRVGNELGVVSPYRAIDPQAVGGYSALS